MNARISPIKGITSTTKNGNDTFPTTSTIETADFRHYRFLKNIMIYASLLDILLTKNSTFFSNFLTEKIFAIFFFANFTRKNSRKIYRSFF